MIQHKKSFLYFPTSADNAIDWQTFSTLHS